MQKIGKNYNKNLNENQININKEEDKINNKNNNSNIILKNKDEKIKKRFSFIKRVPSSKKLSNANSTSKEPSINFQTPKIERIIMNNKDKTPKTEINHLPNKKG